MITSAKEKYESQTYRINRKISFIKRGQKKSMKIIKKTTFTTGLRLDTCCGKKHDSIMKEKEEDNNRIIMLRPKKSHKS